MNNENVKIMEKLINKLNEASDAYYNGKDEIMSNYEWDTMFDELAQLEKETGIILQGGLGKAFLKVWNGCMWTTSTLSTCMT